MSFGLFDAKEEAFIHEINMTPFVDVMLVLLIVFMITVPVLKHAVDMNLPQASSKPKINKPDTVILAIDHSGHYTLDKRVIDERILVMELEKIAISNPQTVLHIYGDQQVKYEYVVKAMSVAHTAGIVQLGFVTRSENKP